MTKKLTKKELKARSKADRAKRLARKEASLASVAKEGCISFFETIGADGWVIDRVEMDSFTQMFLVKLDGLRPYQRQTVFWMLEALFDRVLTKEESGELGSIKEKIDFINAEELIRVQS